MRSFISSLLISVLPMLTWISAGPSLAQQPIARLATPAGVLAVKSVTGADCAPSLECQLIALNDKVLFKDRYATIVAAYPSKEAPSLVEVQTSTGGNACCWENRLIDFTASPPLIVSGVSGGKITPAENGVTIEETAGTDDLGDQLATVFHYKWGSGVGVRLREGPVLSRTAPNQKMSPNEVLSNPTLREPLIKIVGRPNFRDFRRSLLVSGPIKMIGSRSLVSGLFWTWARESQC